MSGVRAGFARPPAPQKKGPAVEDTTISHPSWASRRSSARGVCGTLTARCVERSLNRGGCRRCRALDELIGVRYASSAKKTRPSGARQSRRAPRTRQSVERNMREPEAEKDDVITPVRPPREQIGEDKPDTIVVGDRLASDRQHLRGGIDGGHTRGVLEQPSRPRPRSACQLKHIAGGREAVQRRLNLRGAR